MRGEKFARKWRLIKLSRSRYGDISSEFVAEAVRKLEGAEELLYRIAFRTGRERGKEVKETLRIRSFHDAIEFLSMLSGCKVELGDGDAMFLGCPVYPLTGLRSPAACRGFIEGFLSGVGVAVSASVECGGVCRLSIRVRREG